MHPGILAQLSLVLPDLTNDQCFDFTSTKVYLFRYPESIKANSILPALGSLNNRYLA